MQYIIVINYVDMDNLVPNNESATHSQNRG